jgi:capsular exopolysaccharide synthesis family protein
VSTEPDPRSYLKLLWRWKFLFLAFVIVIPVGVYLITSREKKVYQSSLLLEENALPVDTSILPAGTSSAPSSAPPNAEELGREARVIETPAVATLAATHLTPAPADPSALLASINATPDTKTGLITLVATAHTPRRAADIANAFGHAVVTLRTTQAVALLTATINRMSVQLAHLPASDKVQRGQLSSELDQLRTLKGAQTANAQILQAATPSATPTSPHVGKAVALGVVAALLLGFGAVAVAEMADRRIHHPEDLENLADLPLLSVIPRSAFSPKKSDPRTLEAFQTLRSALMFYNVERPLSTVLIASSIKGEGKTTVAAGLATMAAQAGRDVILVEADLRLPQLQARLRLTDGEIAPGRGLASVLIGQTSLSDALIDVSIRGDEHTDPPALHLDGRLRLLPATDPVPNPSELLASRRMRALLDELTEISDLVVIDSSPLLTVSDALPLLDPVSGVVLVARLNFTTKEAIRRIKRTFANTNAAVLGVVATGATGSSRFGSGYARGYAAMNHANSNGHLGLRGRRGARSNVKRDA